MTCRAIVIKYRVRFNRSLALHYLKLEQEVFQNSRFYPSDEILPVLPPGSSWSRARPPSTSEEGSLPTVLNVVVETNSEETSLLRVLHVVCTWLESIARGCTDCFG